MTVAGVFTRWTWSRVGGSQVLHLVPPDIRRASRTACYRLPVYDATIETPLVLVDGVRRCQGCLARGGRA